MDETDTRKRIVDAVRTLLEEDGWRALRPAAIEARSGLDGATVRRLAPSPLAALRLVLQEIDAAVAGEGPADAADSPRDRLFEIMMRRYDALVPWRATLRSLTRSLPPDPFSAIGFAMAVERSMAAMLEAAGIPSTGLTGALRVRGLCLVHADVLRVLVADDSADLAMTMKALDARLQQVERLAPLLDRFDHLPRSAAKQAGNPIHRNSSNRLPVEHSHIS